ncbi:M23 family metallopeptidase [Aquimarina sp. MMG016]|uniref:M23 family metallopeptidase n=1 Tax=Aquimarina sp. MMG016 TaxID=2822690 RepID=UPI001B39FC3A|nr:M23 family metallopeptidase [Aquimarina sp. MMG016]MBQ4820595.1 M23 family metallopeptidase [Aquimarina sp. MMG016]
MIAIVSYIIKNNRINRNQRLLIIITFVMMLNPNISVVNAQEQRVEGLIAEDSNNLKYTPLFFPINKDDFINISSHYGYRYHPIDHKQKKHLGIDLVAKKGKAVFASADGIVIKSDYQKGYGNRIIIYHIGGAKTLYAHLWRSIVKPGQKVSQGQRIGFVGATGKVTGPHLHYEVWIQDKKINPLVFWKKMMNSKGQKMVMN